jgi:conjugative transfer signal peptidase TraF
MKRFIENPVVSKVQPWVMGIWGLVLAVIALEASLVFFGISIGVNPTASQPYRLFLILKGRPFGRGDLIAFRFPGSEYYAEGSLFVKEVEGMPGDRLEIREDRTVWLNGEFVDHVRASDSKGKAVQPFLFSGIIPEGHYFLYASAPNSYDSRYYGLIRKDRIVGKVIPLF